ncbi:MAG: DUF861 domain-containing protein [Deltaproteobacteria bacterium]|nr:DUF861 domain-containing protein [Deltaproteobacteria bacterium]
MECKLIKGDSLEFGTYGFENINLPSERPKYWDTIKVAGPVIKHRFDYDEVSYIVSGGPLRITCNGKTMEGYAGDFFIFPKGTEIIGQAVNEFEYITFHFPPLDVIMKEREKKFGLKK